MPPFEPPLVHAGLVAIGACSPQWIWPQKCLARSPAASGCGDWDGRILAEKSKLSPVHFDNRQVVNQAQEDTDALTKRPTHTINLHYYLQHMPDAAPCSTSKQFFRRN